MDDAAVFGTTAAVAAVLVPFVSLIKRPSWSPKVNYAVGMVAALIAAVIGALVDGDVNTWGEGAALVLAALGTSQTVYQLYFVNTDVNNRLTETGPQ